MIHSCYSKMVLCFYYCIHFFKIIYMLLNSLTMVGAILIEIYTSASYRPGHWLLSDVITEPQTLLPPPPPLPNLPGPLSIGPGVAAGTTQSGHSKPVLFISPQSCPFHPSVVHSPHGQFVGGTNWVPCRRGVCDWGRGQDRTGEGGVGGVGILHIWFRCDVIPLFSHQMAL